MTPSDALRVALVGCGAVSKLYYTPALQELERRGLVRVDALFDPNPANVTSIHKAFPAASQVREFDELTRSGLDLALVASPPQFHAMQTIQLLKAGLSVFCEKPMALSVAEGEAMVAAASSAGGLLAVGLVRRFLPAAQTIHHLLAQDILGNVKSFSCAEGRVFRWPVQAASYFQDNGVLRDIGVHILDLLWWWWGEPDEIHYEDDAMGGAELNCRIQLRFPRGFSGEVRLSREFRFSNSIAIHGDHGDIRWDIDETDQLQIGFQDSNDYLLGQLHARRHTDPGPILPGQVAVDFHQCFVRQLENMVASIRGTEQITVPGEAGLASLKLIERCYSQRALLDMPWLDEQEILRARQIKEKLLQ